MSTNQASWGTRLKVGIFTLCGLFFIAAMTIYVSHRPFWWRSCQLVHIQVEDATGLKMKSPVKSLGLEIGYLKEVDLQDTHVQLGICITAAVEILPTTKGYIRTDGILGDKFVELKPIRYLESGKPTSSIQWMDWLIPQAHAEEALAASVTEVPMATSQAQAKPAVPKGGKREIPMGSEGQDVQQLMGKMDELVHQMTGLANNLKSGIDPDELRRTMRELNKTLENASKTLAPEGGINQTAQRTLAKLEDSIEQLRDLVTRVNKGEGSVGMLINDPKYADEVREALRNLNKLLTKVGDIRFQVTLGGQALWGYSSSGRGHFDLHIWPKRDRYYHLGICVDPRGQYTQVNQTTTAGGTTTNVQVVSREPTGLLPTAQLGKVFFKRLDLSLGILYGDGALSALINLGPHDKEEMIQLSADVYTRFGDTQIANARFAAIFHLFGLYVRGGIDGIYPTSTGVFPFSIGGGVSFDDEDIRLLFVLR